MTRGDPAHRARRIGRALIDGVDLRASLRSTRDALRAMSRGDLTLSAIEGVRDRELRAAMRDLLSRLREIVLGARAARRDAAALLGGVDLAFRAVAEHSGRHRVALERASDEAKRARAKSDELAPSVAEVLAGAERIALLSVNVGIEGMRGGPDAARAMVTLGEEIRRAAQRVEGTAELLAEGARSVSESLATTVARIDEARGGAQSLGEEVNQAAAAVASARGSAQRLEAALSGVTALDDETEALVESVSASAERLIAALRQVRERVHGDAAGSAALESIARVTRALAALDEG